MQVKTLNKVECLGRAVVHLTEVDGENEPGWYWFNEVWKGAGPFKDERDARNALHAYCRRWL